MKELYMEPDLQVVYFASMQRIAVDIEGGLGDETSEVEGDAGLDIL